MSSKFYPRVHIWFQGQIPDLKVQKISPEHNVTKKNFFWTELNWIHTDKLNTSFFYLIGSKTLIFFRVLRKKKRFFSIVLFGRHNNVHLKCLLISRIFYREIIISATFSQISTDIFFSNFKLLYKKLSLVQLAIKLRIEETQIV